MMDDYNFLDDYLPPEFAVLPNPSFDFNNRATVQKAYHDLARYDTVVNNPQDTTLPSDCIPLTIPNPQASFSYHEDIILMYEMDFNDCIYGQPFKMNDLAVKFKRHLDQVFARYQFLRKGGKRNDLGAENVGRGFGGGLSEAYGTPIEWSEEESKDWRRRHEKGFDDPDMLPAYVDKVWRDYQEGREGLPEEYKTEKYEWNEAAADESEGEEVDSTPEHEMSEKRMPVVEKVVETKPAWQVLGVIDLPTLPNLNLPGKVIQPVKLVQPVEIRAPGTYENFIQPIRFGPRTEHRPSQSYQPVNRPLKYGQPRGLLPSGLPQKIVVLEDAHRKRRKTEPFSFINIKHLHERTRKLEVLRRHYADQNVDSLRPRLEEIETLEVSEQLKPLLNDISLPPVQVESTESAYMNVYQTNALRKMLELTSQALLDEDQLKPVEVCPFTPESLELITPTASVTYYDGSTNEGEEVLENVESGPEMINTKEIAQSLIQQIEDKIIITDDAVDSGLEDESSYPPEPIITSYKDDMERESELEAVALIVATIQNGMLEKDQNISKVIITNTPINLVESEDKLNFTHIAPFGKNEIMEDEDITGTFSTEEVDNPSGSENNTSDGEHAEASSTPISDGSKIIFTAATNEEFEEEGIASPCSGNSNEEEQTYADFDFGSRCSNQEEEKFTSSRTRMSAQEEKDHVNLTSRSSNNEEEEIISLRIESYDEEDEEEYSNDSAKSEPQIHQTPFWQQEEMNAWPDMYTGMTWDTLPMDENDGEVEDYIEPPPHLVPVGSDDVDAVMRDHLNFICQS